MTMGRTPAISTMKDSDTPQTSCVVSARAMFAQVDASSARTADHDTPRSSYVVWAACCGKGDRGPDQV